MEKYNYHVPENKRIRLLLHTDCANEADDQFAVAHALMTPRCDVRGIIAAHFDFNTKLEMFPYHPGTTAQASMEEISRVLHYMGKEEDYPVALGAELPLENEQTPRESEGARMIIEEAMREDEKALYIGCQGSLTDLASAILMKPEICHRMTAIWIGGGDYPEGGTEFNLVQDIHAANILFSSDMPVWQIPMKVYKSFAVSLAELQYKVSPCGDIGQYLFDKMVKHNMMLSFHKPWPHGEIWGLGDQGVMAALMQEYERKDNYHMQAAPNIDANTLQYVYTRPNREIRVYDWMDVRLTLEDFYAKLAINYR